MAKSTKKTVELASINPSDITELSGWEKKQKELVKEHPFVQITDTESYEEAKKNRTALRTGRTELQKQDKTIGSYLREFRTKTKEIAEKLVNITKPHEEKQQAEIDVWEAELQRKRDEKERIEQERIDRIKNKIDETEKSLSKITGEMTFENRGDKNNEFGSVVSESDEFDFEEFRFLYDEMLEREENKFDENVTRLLNDEQTRVERLQESQRAKMNELKLAAMESIDSYKHNEKGTMENDVKKILSIDYDFGDFTKEFESIKTEMLKKAKSKISSAKFEHEIEQKRIDAEEVQQQREKLFHWREGLFSDIRSMTKSNYTEETNKIKESISSVDLPRVAADVKKAIPMIEAALTEKLESIANELSLEKEREEKLKKEQSEKMNLRLKKIKDEIDIPYDFKEQAYIGKGAYVPNLDIQTKTDEEFDKMMLKIKEHIKKNPPVKDVEVDAEVVEVDEDSIPQSDKDAMIEWVNHSVRIKTPSNIGLNSKKAIELHLKINEWLNEWCDVQCETIKASK